MRYILFDAHSIDASARALCLDLTRSKNREAMTVFGILVI